MSDYKFEKTPAEVLAFGRDWSEWLRVGETITASVWTSSPSGLTLTAASNTTTQTQVMVSAGVLSTVYTLTNHITTSSGQQAERSYTISIKTAKYL